MTKARLFLRIQSALCVSLTLPLSFAACMAPLAAYLGAARNFPDGDLEMMFRPLCAVFPLCAALGFGVLSVCAALREKSMRRETDAAQVRTSPNKGGETRRKRVGEADGKRVCPGFRRKRIGRQVCPDFWRKGVEICAYGSDCRRAGFDFGGSPAGTFEGAMGLLSNPNNRNLFRMLGVLFTRKFIIMLVIGLVCAFCYRAFCRFLCPLGAIYGLLNRFCLIGVKVDATGCNNCGACDKASRLATLRALFRGGL